MRVLLTVLICGVTPALAAAQTAPVALPANDATVSVGWAGSEHRVYDMRQWYGSLLFGASAGHYWTDHLKTEIDASWNSPREREVYQNVERDGGYTFAISDYRARDARVGIMQLYQFGRNEWVHPYVGVGVDVVRRETTLERVRQVRTVFAQNRNVTVEIPAADERSTAVFGHAVLKTGLKMYLSEKAFVTTELRLGLRSDIDHASWKFGLGVDF